MRILGHFLLKLLRLLACLGSEHGQEGQGHYRVMTAAQLTGRELRPKIRERDFLAGP